MSSGIQHPWVIFSALALTILMVDIDTTAANLAVSAIVNDLGLTLTVGQWLINGTSMGAAVMMAFAGKCGDKIGFKKVFGLGIILFFAASLLAGLAKNTEMLVAGRILQGICIALTFPLSVGILNKVFPKNQAGLPISLLLSTAGVAMSIGPTFGGLMIKFFSWRYIFLINAPISIFAFILFFYSYQEEHQPMPINADYLSLSAFTIGLFSLMAVLNNLDAISIIAILALLMIGALLLFFYARRETVSEHPLLELSLFQSRGFSLAIVLRFFMNFLYFSLLFGLGLILHDALGYSSAEAGTIMLALTLIITVLAVPVGKLLAKYSGARLIQVGMTLLMVACLGLSLNLTYHHLVSLLITLLIAGTGISLCIPSSSMITLAEVSKEQSGSAMGILFTCGFLGNSFGVAITGTIMGILSSLAGFQVTMILCALGCGASIWIASKILP